MNNLGSIITIIVLLVSMVTSHAVQGERIATQQKRIDQLESRYVNREVLELNLDPIRKDISTNKDNIKHILTNVHQINIGQDYMRKDMLKILKAINLGHVTTGSGNRQVPQGPHGAHTKTR